MAVVFHLDSVADESLNISFMTWINFILIRYIYDSLRENIVGYFRFMKKIVA